jgi:hypothetical protein
MPRFFASLLVSRVWDISSGIGPCFPWMDDCANFTPVLEKLPKTLYFHDSLK